MVRIRRRHARRLLGKLALHGVPEQVDLHQIAVVDAVEEGAGDGGDVVTVGMVAERLGIDPSRASRVVAVAVANGLVRRVASQQDGRRVGLELTERGRDIIDQAHRARQALYHRMLKSWDPKDRATLATLLTRFVDAMDATAATVDDLPTTVARDDAAQGRRRSMRA